MGEGFELQAERATAAAEKAKTAANAADRYEHLAAKYERYADVSHEMARAYKSTDHVYEALQSSVDQLVVVRTECQALGLPTK